MSLIIKRDDFLTPFDRMFDSMFETNFPEVAQTVGVNPFSGTAYPKVNVYEYEDKVGVVAEIPGIDKKNLDVEVEDGVMTIKGSKHGFDEDAEATVLRRELKHSAFERKFTLGESLDGDDITANFKDGILSIEIPKIEPEQPKKTFVKIS
jgi:HSP20 family protein|tara:strand:+ start:11603 stop:12052 length:450 start_codon:yes stop_codon:yes gene_type:complete